MGISAELISQFVKATKTEKPVSKESTHAGKIVIYEDKQYVQLDGSDLLTPISTTVEAKDGERVNVTIKDHSATVTGNYSSPAARTDDLKDAVKQITDVEILVADRVSTEQLEAQIGRIDELVSDNVTIKEELDANKASINELTAKDVEITGKLEVTDAEIDELKTTKLDAEIADLTYATIEKLNATNANIHNLEATYGDFEDLVSDKFEANDATISRLETDMLTAEEADLRYAAIERLNAAIADIEELFVDVADIDTLIFGSATGDTIHTNFANAVIAQLGNAQIKSAMIESIVASKITSGDIITNNVRVLSEDGSLIISDETIQISDDNRVRVQIGKDSSNDYSINIWDANGNLMFSEGGITDNAIKDAIIRNDMVSADANISASKLDINSLFEEINGSTKTIKSTKIYLDDKGQTLNVAFENMETDVEGLSNDISTQGTQLSIIQGQIDSKVWQQDINEATGDLETAYSQLSQDLDSISTTVAQHTTAISNKADNTKVTNISENVTKLEQDLSGFKTTVSETYISQNDAEDLVDGVATRVSAAESMIEQHTTAINLSVTQEVFEETLEGYYTIHETDSKISESANSITLSVNQKTSELEAIIDDSIKSTQRYYISQTADATPPTIPTTYPPTGWSSDEPEYDEETTLDLYFVDCYVYSDDTFSYSDVQLSSSYEAMKQAQNASNTASDAQGLADDAQIRLTEVESSIQLLKDNIRMLVTDENGASLMVQNGDSWTLNINGLQETLDSTSSSLNDLTNTVGSVNETVSRLSLALDDLGLLGEYIKITTLDDEPCIALGESDSDFKLFITNTRIVFTEGSSTTTYIRDNTLHTNRIHIEEELQQGNFAWIIRPNGHLSLVWKG